MAYYAGRPCKKGHDGTRYKTNRSCVTCTIEYARERQRSGLEDENHRKRQIRYQKKHPDRANAKSRAYHGRYPHKAIERKKKRRSLLFGAPGLYTAEDVLIILEAQRGLCFYCGCQLSGWHEDHFVPLSKGGVNYRCNIVLACATCNLKKGSKAPAEFMNWKMKTPVFWKEGNLTNGN